MKLTRRQMIRLGAAGLGGSVLGTAGAPMLAPLRRALAAPTALAGAGAGAIFIVLNGGARTQAVFNGTVGSGANPFGSVSGVPVPISRVLEGSGLDDPTINGRLNLIATCQHHNRTANHDTGRVVACTGYEPQEAKPGILTILNYLFAFREVPCVHIGNDTPTTDIGSEISSTFSPIKIRSPLDVEQIVASLLDTRVSDAEQRRLDTLRYTLSDRFLRQTSHGAPADIPYYQQRAAEVAARFTDDALDIRSGSSMGTYRDGTEVDNAGLRSTFGVNGDGSGSRMGAKAMLAIRLRQLGCAGIVLSSDSNWDMHSNEETSLPGRAFEVGRTLAGLVDRMSRIESSRGDGSTLLDTTVITVLTDFNRGNWSSASGFNGNRGSDHIGNEDKTCYQCIPILGGGLPGGKILGEITSNGTAAGASPIYQTRQVLATVLDLMGIEPARFFPESVTALSEELVR